MLLHARFYILFHEQPKLNVVETSNLLQIGAAIWTNIVAQFATITCIVD